jgi:hypothetical protein
MAIIEKPSDPGEIFATSEEALKHGSPVIDIAIGDYVESLDHPEVQQVLVEAQDRCAEVKSVSVA